MVATRISTRGTVCRHGTPLPRPPTTTQGVVPSLPLSGALVKTKSAPQRQTGLSATSYPPDPTQTALLVWPLSDRRRVWVWKCVVHVDCGAPRHQKTSCSRLDCTRWRNGCVRGTVWSFTASFAGHSQHRCHEVSRTPRSHLSHTPLWSWSCSSIPSSVRRCPGHAAPPRYTCLTSFAVFDEFLKMQLQNCPDELRFNATSVPEPAQLLSPLGINVGLNGLQYLTPPTFQVS